MRTKFGSITFEETSDSESESSSFIDDRIKVLRLKEGPEYDIEITGTADGKMEYSIKLANEYGEYIDSRDFNDIAINSQTVINTVADNSATSVLKVDDDGDGEYDMIYEAESNSKAKLLTDIDDMAAYSQKDEGNKWMIILIGAVGIITLLIVLLLLRSMFRIWR